MNCHFHNLPAHELSLTWTESTLAVHSHGLIVTQADSTLTVTHMD